MRRQALLGLATVVQVQALGLRTAGSFLNELFVRSAVALTQFGLGLTLLANQEEFYKRHLQEKENDEDFGLA